MKMVWLRCIKEGDSKELRLLEMKRRENSKQRNQRKIFEKSLKVNNGERALNYLTEDEDDSLEAKWIDHGPKPRDLTTLVLNIFLRKLNVGLSLETSQMLSLDGQSIYVVVKADLADLKKIAEESEYTMQMAIGLTDLTSLEPWDKYLRPLRKWDSGRVEIDELNLSLAEYYAIIEGCTQELLTEKPLEYQQEDLVEGDVTNEEWETFHEYLISLKEGFDEFKIHTYDRPHIKGVHLKSLAVNALDFANKKRNNKGKLYNLWERIGVNYPIGAYAEYDDAPSLEHYWRRYIEDETMRRTIFRDSDKIRLTQILIEKIIDNNKLVHWGFIYSCFNFHNNFELFGKK